MILKALLELNDLTVNMAVLDAAGVIVGVNSAWKSFGDANGLRTPDHGLGRAYGDYCAGFAEAQSLREEIRRLLDGEIHVTTFTYPCHSPRQARWFLMIGLSLSRLDRAGAILLHVNLTELSPLVFAVRDMPAPGRPLVGTVPEIALDAVAEVVQHAIDTAMDPSDGESPRRARATSDGRSSLARTSAPSSGSVNRLTVRQREVFRLIGEGKSNQEIADAMGLSANTVKIYVSGILRQLGLKSRTQVALFASRALKE